MPKDEIFSIIKNWYKGIEKDIEQWYSTPNRILNETINVSSKLTPRELINLGYEDNVLKYLKVIIR